MVGGADSWDYAGHVRGFLLEDVSAVYVDQVARVDSFSGGPFRRKYVGGTGGRTEAKGVVGRAEQGERRKGTCVNVLHTGGKLDQRLTKGAVPSGGKRRPWTLMLLARPPKAEEQSKKPLLLLKDPAPEFGEIRGNVSYRCGGKKRESSAHGQNRFSGEFTIFVRQLE